MSHRSLTYYWKSYLPVLLHFRNGAWLAWLHYQASACERAVFWNGRELRSPQGRSGLVETVVEIWGGEVYTAGGFYRPADNDVILDIGANVGVFSMWVAHRAPRARIIALEPFNENFLALRRNLDGWNHRIAAYRLAVSGSGGSCAIVDGGARSLDHRLMVVGGDHSANVTERVDVVTLEEAVQLTGVDQVDLLKMDIEGAEFDVFSRATPRILRHFRRIALEYHDNLRPGTLAMLRERLASTHAIVSVDSSPEGYGIIQASLRAGETQH